MEIEIFFTSKIEGAKTTRVRTTEIHNGAPIDENNKDSETMVRNGFRAVKILNLYGNKISKDILCEVWNILVEDCCQNEDIRGAEDEYRIGDIWVGNHEGVPHPDMEDDMKRWIAFYNGEELNEHLFLKAAVLHYAFENIHPLALLPKRFMRRKTMNDTTEPRGFDYGRVKLTESTKTIRQTAEDIVALSAPVDVPESVLNGEEELIVKEGEETCSETEISLSYTSQSATEQ